MKYKATTPKEYIEQLPADRQIAIKKIRAVINKNLPAGFQEQISYNMLGWVVPLSKYPEGYHCDPSLPLPFINLASQKNFVALYHMAVYADKKLLDWFTSEYPKHSDAKLDMGKSCIRFKNLDKIPIELIGELVKKVSLKKWVADYEKYVKR